jgi:hypothetical protein
MRIIETHHFKSKWSERVGTKEPRLRELICTNIEQGRTVRHYRQEFGIMVTIQTKGKTFGVIGIPTKKQFILKTVLDSKVASSMGWGSL